MKTVVIWNEIESLRYSVVGGDWTRFEGVYINTTSSDQKLQKLQEELADLVYDPDSGDVLINFVGLNSVRIALLDPKVKLVECGFIP